MKKLLPILVVLALIGGGAYLYFNQGGNTGNLSPAKEAFKGTLQTAVSKGVPVKCEMQDEGTTITTWVKGEKMYAENTVEGKMQYTIFKESCTWSWGEGESQGVKFCFDEEIDYSEFDPAEYSGSDGMEYEAEDAEMPEYSCVPTVVSDEKFNPPSDVNFMSF